MKELYEEVKIEVINFDAEDIIVTSGDFGAASVGGALDSGSMIG